MEAKTSGETRGAKSLRYLSRLSSPELSVVSVAARYERSCISKKPRVSLY